MPKYEHELAATRRMLEQTRIDFEETVKVAELLYETNRRVGAVTDYLLKKHEMSQDDESPKSFEAMFSWVQKQAESEAQPDPEGENKDGSGNDEARPAD